ncbi:MAG: pyridoxamine 5'-phosphate oxidase family protein [Janthinobacterium lividum]
MQASVREFIEAGLAALERSVRNHEGDLRNVQLATLSPGMHPGLRTLVLRSFVRSPPCVEMHSDARADKVRDIAHAGQVALLAWSDAEHLQLRFEGTARLHRDDEIARGRWDALSPNARNTYGHRATPGTPIADPAEQVHLSAEEQFRQFTVILVSLTNVDVLRLGPGGQQTRASGRFTSSGVTAAWISA